MSLKTITLSLSPTELRVLRNALNHEWEHLQFIKTPLGVKIANEKDAEERAGQTHRYESYTAQQEATNALLLKLEGI